MDQQQGILPTTNPFLLSRELAEREQQSTAVMPPRELVFQIQRVENGFIVHAGCKTLVSQSIEEVVDGIKLYYKNPEEAISKYCRKKE